MFSRKSSWLQQTGRDSCKNHPSGTGEPSHADEQITKRLKDALALIDVRVLDHLVVGEEVISFAERGLLDRLLLTGRSLKNIAKHGEVIVRINNIYHLLLFFLQNIRRIPLKKIAITLV